MPWPLPIRVSTDLFISLQLVACVCGKDKNFILQVSRLCVEDSIKICDGMEKPPTKKRRGPYGKRNYDSEPLTLQPIPLTLEPISLTLQPISLTLEAWKPMYSSLLILYKTAVPFGPRYFTRSI